LASSFTDFIGAPQQQQSIWFSRSYKPLAGDEGASPAVMFARNAIKDHVLVDIEIQRANVLLTLRRLRMERAIFKRNLRQEYPRASHQVRRCQNIRYQGAKESAVGFLPRTLGCWRQPKASGGFITCASCPVERAHNAYFFVHRDPVFSLGTRAGRLWEPGGHFSTIVGR
jgi:hypothetical protein